ncbi:GGDEF domain-containing protein [Legionella spiritensis]|uniref:GGDEF domain-containing protein n=1 Tax=Legionella spiritensis TaxID=452 RepID=UPI000F6DF9EA|nr:GGDEF domain-containing protein [Legionella spiritensis]VEG92240.1 sensory box protein, EAL domain, GGDEF domain, signal transduction protein [Legionella spiritensis]
MGLANLFKKKPYSESDSLINHQRQYRMIKTVTIELIILGFLIIYVYFIYRIWDIVFLVAIANLLSFCILLLLHRTRNTMLCGHLITINLIMTTVAGNLLMAGVSSSYFVWFNVIPILAAVVVSGVGLIIYSAITLGIIVLLFFHSAEPVSWLPSSEVVKLDFLNYLFSLLITCTLLYSLLKANVHYEQLLYEQNYLLKADKEKFHYLARYDHLTNLPNRPYFLTTVEHMISNAKPYQYLTIFFMDLDGFKRVNDHFGHEIGDGLLMQTGKRLQTCFREDDFLARLGGDEFTAILKHSANDKTPEAIARRILREFNKSFVINKVTIDCKISIGLATFPVQAQSDDELIARADMAMYDAKKSGGNAYRIANSQCNKTANSS